VNLAPRLILVGRVAGAFGVRGEVRIAPFGDDPMALVRYRHLLDREGRPALEVLSGRPHKEALVVRAEGIASKETADALRGLDLYAPRDAFAAPTDEDEFYLADLVGLEVVHLDGRPLGRVRAVQNFGAGDILEIDPPEGGASFYLPFTRAAVPEVKLTEGRIIADPPGELE
jgi:16S rRNA processing protein RimM